MSSSKQIEVGTRVRFNVGRGTFKGSVKALDEGGNAYVTRETDGKEFYRSTKLITRERARA